MGRRDRDRADWIVRHDRFRSAPFDGRRCRGSAGSITHLPCPDAAATGASLRARPATRRGHRRGRGAFGSPRAASSACTRRALPGLRAHGFAPGSRFWRPPKGTDDPRRAVRRRRRLPIVADRGGQALIASCGMPTGGTGSAARWSRCSIPGAAVFSSPASATSFASNGSIRRLDVLSIAAEAGEFCARHDIWTSLTWEGACACSRRSGRDDSRRRAPRLSALWRDPGGTHGLGCVQTARFRLGNDRRPLSKCQPAV